MIRFTLKCENDHCFESWFASGDAFDTLKSGGMVSCPTCASIVVDKTIMAPPVRPARNSANTNLSKPQSNQEMAIAKLKSDIEANSEYVGMEFASKAREIHDGEAPERSIYGEAKPEEAIKLLEDGVPVAPLPFIPKRKTN